MIPQRTSRVVVIDDEAAEAMPIIKSLGRLGIGCTYIPGDEVEELPESPLAGIRIVFLDMQLGTSGTSRMITSHTANVFAKTVAANAGPILAVLWTKHKEYVEDFKRALFENNAEFRSRLFFAVLEKPASAALMDLGDVLSGIQTELAKHSPLDVIWAWEQVAHDAATETTAELSRIAASAAIAAEVGLNSRTSQAALLSILQSLAEASAGKHVSVETAGGDLLQSLGELHHDSMQNIANSGTFGFDEIGAPAAAQDVTIERRAALNAMLLTAPVRAGDTRIRPGNVYLAHSDHNVFPFAGSGMRREIVMSEFFFGDSQYKNASQAADQRRVEGDEIGEREKRGDAEKRLQELAPGCAAVMVELTPPCDHAQKKSRVARFTAGLFLPTASGELPKALENKGPSFYKIGPLLHPRNAGGCSYIVLSARLPAAIAEPGDNVNQVADFRLRTAVLANVQHWFAAQAARPGHLSL